MIDGTGHPADTLIPMQEETTMFKTISAALIAASVLAAPAFAATTKSTEAPATKADQVKAAPVKTGAKASTLNANAKMSKHHVKHVRHHKISAVKPHKKIGAIKSHAKVSLKHTSHTATKRG
jgi:hypothetical protein